MSAKLTGLCVGILLVICSLAASIMLGSTKISFHTVIDAFTSFDGTREHLIVRSVRLPRALIAMTVGASLALAGGIMQALTRNALAGPEIFGINYGAALMAVTAGFLFSHSAVPVYTWFSFIGAGLACLLVFGLASAGQGGLTSLKLVLAGATINLLLASLTQGILIFNEQSLDEMRFWLAGSVTGRDLDLFNEIVPYMLAGLLLTLLMSKQINLLSLGDEVAAGLGQRVILTKAALIGVIMLLAGSAVAIAGPIGFVGLAVPHLARLTAGQDYRWILPYSAVWGALLLLVADIGARFVLPNQEIPVGVVTAFLGAPFLIYLAQRKG